MGEMGRPELDEFTLRYRWRGRGRVAQLSEGVGLSETATETAEQVYVEAQRADLIAGRGVATIVAGSVLVASRLHDEQLAAEDLAPLCTDTPETIQDTRRVLERELSLGVPPRRPPECLDDIVERLDIDSGTVDAARTLLDEGIDAGIANGRHPEGVAAGALLAVATEETITKADLVNATTVTANTVRSRYNEFEDLVD